MKFKERIFYASPSMVISMDPDNGKTPMLTLKGKGVPTLKDWVSIKWALRLAGMEIVGSPTIDEFEHWSCPVREVRGDGREELRS